MFDGAKWSPVAFKIKVCHSGQGIFYSNHTVTPSQFSKVTSWLNQTRIPLCASQHSSSIPPGPTFQFQVFPEDKLQGTRNGTQTILSSCLHSLCKICISKFERICWLGHTSDLLLAGQAVPWRRPWHLNVLCYAWVVLPSNFEPNSSKIRDYLLYCFFKKTDKS